MSVTCPRCKGLMVEESFDDLEYTTGLAFTGLRCLICGEIVDRVISQNRILRPEPLESRARIKAATGVVAV